MTALQNPTLPTDAPGTGWPVHVEIQVDGHPGDDVTQAAASALVDELRQFGAAAFGGRGFVTLICASPAADLPPEEAPTASARVIDAALRVVSRFAPVRRIHTVDQADQD